MRKKRIVIVMMFSCFLLLLSKKVYASGGLTDFFQLNNNQQSSSGGKLDLIIDVQEGDDFLTEINEQPSPVRNLSDFLTDILGYQTAILVLLIPLSIDVISRISGRYKSDVINQRFQKEWIFIALVLTLTLNILLIIVSRFFSIESLVINILVLILTLFSTFLMLAFFHLIISYSRGISYIKKKLLDDAKQLLN